MIQTVCVRHGLKHVSALFTIFVAGLSSAGAATLCVNPAASSGCMATIGAAITAAAPGDTIQVGAGNYKEAVVITTSVSLVGAGSATTIIDATGLPNGIWVNGPPAFTPGVSNVVITGFTVENANFQGILVQNASAVTIANNQILGNDKSLDVTPATGPVCPGLAAILQGGEADDCGEGLNLTGVDHSIVSNNVIQKNSGGILISDDTGATHDNLISGNLVSNNGYDCGITMASHSGMGVYHNTVYANQSINNGTVPPGAGAGVGMFAPHPGSQTYGNVVVGNIVSGNGQPGISMHNHAYAPNTVKFDDNMIVGNIISGNLADSGDTATPTTTGINIASIAPMNGTMVAENMISGEGLGLGYTAPGKLIASLNNFMVGIGVDNGGTGDLQATQNWWNCPTGPGGGCASVIGAATSSAWLTSPFSATQLPPSPLPPSTGGGGAGPTIVVTGPGNATSSTNTFQTVFSQIVLSASQSTSANAGALSYSWKSAPGFPSVGIIGGNTSTATFQLSSPGTYQLVLTVTDATGATATSTITVQYL